VTGHVGDGSITDAKLSGTISASKLTGAMPALDGSTLTGVPGITKNASDPAADTNPSGGVGTLWANSTSGEMFVCTDATTDANVWTNVGGGTGDIVPVFYQGETYVYATGMPPNSPANGIEKFLISNEATRTDVGDYSATKNTGSAPGKSSTHGYSIGGSPYVGGETIEKYSFASGVQNGSVLSFNSSYQGAYRAGFSDGTYAYCTGRYTVVSGVEYTTTTIERFNTSVEAAIEGHGDLTQTCYSPGFHSSATDGYTTGGEGAPGGSTYYSVCNKFSFTSNVTAALHGNLGHARGTGSCYNTPTHGYTAGGRSTGETGHSRICKMSFASNTTTTEVGNLSSVRAYMTGGASAVDFGYTMGGSASGTLTGSTTVLEKHTYSNDTDSGTVGNLSSASLTVTPNQI
jgi:hypothetical protein